MKTKTITLYNYDELSESAKGRALDWYYRGWTFDDWHEFIYDDAENIGLKITSFDTGRSNDIKGHLIEDMPDVIYKILKEHGKDCDTYKLAESWEKKLRLYLEENLDDDYPNEIDDFISAYQEEFEKELLEEYLTMLKKEYEFQTSREMAEENIQANEYTFTENGERMN